jgi:hypothetical protein
VAVAAGGATAVLCAVSSLRSKEWRGSEGGKESEMCGQHFAKKGLGLGKALMAVGAKGQKNGAASGVLLLPRSSSSLSSSVLSALMLTLMLLLPLSVALASLSLPSMLLLSTL